VYADTGPQVRTEEDGVADGADGGGEDGDDSKPRNGLPWDGTDRDYMYEELLGTRLDCPPLLFRNPRNPSMTCSRGDSGSFASGVW